MYDTIQDSIADVTWTKKFSVVANLVGMCATKGGGATPWLNVVCQPRSCAGLATRNKPPVDGMVRCVGTRVVVDGRRQWKEMWTQ